MLPEADLQITGAGFDGWIVVHAEVREALSEVYEAAVVLTHPAIPKSRRQSRLSRGVFV